MIILALMRLAMSIFTLALGIMRALVPSAFANIQNGISSMAGSQGWRLGLGIFDRAVGIDFLFMALSSWILIFLVARGIAWIRGIITKA